MRGATATRRGPRTIGNPARRLTLAGIATLFVLASCTAERTLPAEAPTPVLVEVVPSPSAARAIDTATTVVVDVPLATIDDAALGRALAAFRASCGKLQSREDSSGLTRPGDWAGACAQAANTAPNAARAFFTDAFAAVRVGDGTAFATGYFEPEIAGSRTKLPGYGVPVYGVPDDLVTVDLGQFADDLKGRTVRGRVVDDRLVKYPDRSEIETAGLGDHAPIIGWAQDAVELFFLQVQGSGRLRAPDGTVMRIGYAGQNGRSYVGIGKLLADRGELPPGQRSMQGIVTYLNADPARGTGVMRENPSYIFFTELTGAGPLGALGIAVAPRTTVAADPNFVPLGAPVLLDLDRAEADGIWVAQDTGGAIKGANRFDTFWGAGAEARRIAGGMSGRGTALILLPRAAAARLTAAAP